MKVVVKTIQEDLDEQIAKLTAEGKKITCIEMTSAELEQFKKELESLLHFDIKRVGQKNQYRGYEIKIVEPAPKYNRELGNIGPFGVYENPCLPKDKVIFTPLPRPSRKSLWLDMLNKIHNKEIKLPEFDRWPDWFDFEDQSRINRLTKEVVRLGQVANELKNNYVQAEKDKAIMRDALMSIQHLTKSETGSVAIQCNQWSTSALDQVKP
jgi:hypothetical protein